MWAAAPTLVATVTAVEKTCPTIRDIL